MGGRKEPPSPGPFPITMREGVTLWASLGLAGGDSQNRPYGLGMVGGRDDSSPQIAPLPFDTDRREG